MSSPKLNKSPPEPARRAWPLVYTWAVLIFIVLAALLLQAGRRFNDRARSLQKLAEALGRQQVLSERIRSVAAEQWNPRSDRRYLDARLHDVSGKLEAAQSSAELCLNEATLPPAVTQELRGYLDQVRGAWAQLRFELKYLAPDESPRQWGALDQSCSRLQRLSSYFMQRALDASRDNQDARRRLIHGYAAILVFLGLVVTWSLWSASRSRMQISSLNTALEQRVAERTAQLERANTFLASVQSSICSALIVVDASNRILSWNRAAEELWGVKSDQARGHDIFSLLPVKDLDYFRMNLIQTQSSGRAFFIKEMALQNAGGRTMYGNAALVPLGGLTSSARGAVLLIDDVTEMVQARRELARRAEQIAQANQALQRANIDLEQFVYTASHDLRGPLNNLFGLTRKLERSFKQVRDSLSEGGVGSREAVDAVVDRDIPRALSQMNSSVVKFGALIDGLLKYSRTGREDYVTQPLDMNREVGRALDLFAQQIEESGVDVEVAELHPARGDPEAVNKVLSNLIGNSLNYLDPQRRGRITIDSWRLGSGSCRYSVRDNGIGIREQDLHRVFNIFERLDPRHTTGEGLGLAIVKKIIERLGGEVSVVSTRGEGSTFSFTLPAAPVTADAEAGSPVA